MVQPGHPNLMASLVIDDMEYNANTGSLDVVASATPACASQTTQLFGVDDSPVDLTSVGKARISSTAGFMATELLKRPPSSSFARRTVSHDLQSFCWVLICVSFKHAAAELKTKSTSDIKEIAEFDNMNFRQEFHALFSAAPGSAKDLATKRKVAFQQESGTGQALAYAGIENLHNYVDSKDVALASHLRIIWHFLKMCEPLQTVGVDQKLTAEERAFLRRVTGNAPDAEASNAQFRAFTVTFNHANLIRVLEMGFNKMADWEQATSAQSA